MPQLNPAPLHGRQTSVSGAAAAGDIDPVTRSRLAGNCG